MELIMKRLLATYKGAEGHIIDVFITENSLLIDDGYKHSCYSRREKLSVKDDVRQAVSEFLHKSVPDYRIDYHC
jgi:hypothetical protein